MGISLSKGGNVSLSKEEPGLEEITIGLGWEARGTDGAPFDLDASLFGLGANNKVRAAGPNPNDVTEDLSDFCFYKNLELFDGAVKHTGDNRDGQGDDDDEQIDVILGRIPQDVTKLAVVVTIANAKKLNLNFGSVTDAFVRVVNKKTGREIVRYDLSEDAAGKTAIIVGEVYRYNGEWKFRAVTEGFADGLYRICRLYGIDAKDDG